MGRRCTRRECGGYETYDEVPVLPDAFPFSVELRKVRVESLLPHVYYASKARKGKSDPAVWCDGSRLADGTCGIGVTIMGGDGHMSCWSGRVGEDGCSSVSAELVAICVASELSAMPGIERPVILTDSCAYATCVLDPAREAQNSFELRFKTQARGVRLSYAASHREAGNIIVDRLAKFGTCIAA